MKVAMIGQKGIFVTHNGGIETHVSELSRHLVKLGVQIFVYCRPHYNKNLLGKKDYQGINLIFKPSIKTKYLDAISHTFICTLDAIKRKFDIIHYHGVGPSTLSFLPRLFSRVKVVGTFHSQDRFHQKWGPLARKYLEFGEWTICKFPCQTICVSKTLKRYCQERFKRETIYIPNGVDIREVKSCEEIKKWGLEKNKYILSVARFVKHKGLHYLIQAYKNLRKKDEARNFKLVLVGESPYPSIYADYLKKLAVDDPGIIFCGYQTGKTLDQLFAAAHLYVHPSESEGLSLTILEAMSRGICVLISDIEENMEAMGAFGFYFKSKNERDLEEKLLKLLKDPDVVYQMGQKAKEFVRKEHNWPWIAKKTLEIYRNLFMEK